MMFTELEASGFSHKGTFYIGEFETLLSKVVSCYNLMLSASHILANDENEIRDILLISYLKDTKVRQSLQLEDFLFDREVPEDATIGRTDIKIQTLNTFKDTSAYYILECKRLDSTNTEGTTGLNAKYIEKGICRFTTNYYSSSYRVNGMIGFIVDKVHIHENIGKINTLLDSFKQANSVIKLSRANFIDGFEYHYQSKHLNTDQKEIVLCHLMLDVLSKMAK